MNPFLAATLITYSGIGVALVGIFILPEEMQSFKILCVILGVVFAVFGLVVRYLASRMQKKIQAEKTNKKNGRS